MIIMDVFADNLYAFNKFHINMSYPKRIVDSMVEGEFLEERPNFRYKKVNVIMGSNASGKTTLGKLLMLFANYFNDGSYSRFVSIIANKKKRAHLKIDFVTDVNRLYRFLMLIDPPADGEYKKEDVTLQIFYTAINARDNYETCAERLNQMDCEQTAYDKVRLNGWFFSYPQDARKNINYSSVADNERYLPILERVLKTLDPSVKEVKKLKEAKNAFVIKLENAEVIVHDGKIADADMLSSGTKAGMDIAFMITSLLCDSRKLYYCDEMFSYVNSDIEKACLSIFVDKLAGRKQLFFTTHNMDILDMQLPKHSFSFMKKEQCGAQMQITCVNAGHYLKRSTDSLKRAVENDLFCTAPELEKLYEIAGL